MKIVSSIKGYNKYTRDDAEKNVPSRFSLIFWLQYRCTIQQELFEHDIIENENNVSRLET